MSKELARLFAKNFIQRPDVKAVQLNKSGGGLQQGDYFPDSRVNEERRPNSPHLPHGFNMAHLQAHLAGERTYGHYLLDQDSNTKMFAFDIDIEKSGSYITIPNWDEAPEFTAGHEEEDWFREHTVTHIVDGSSPENLRDLWVSRRRSAAPARAWLKYQLRYVATRLAAKVVELEIPCAVAYSGSKGVHVYGMMGTTPADEARQAALLVLDMVDEFELKRGKNFYMHKNNDPWTGFSNLSVEVFPKQESLDGKKLGNLMRLPLGTNYKNPKDPTFFMDLTGPAGEFKPVADPIKTLETGNPFL